MNMRTNFIHDSNPYPHPYPYPLPLPPNPPTVIGLKSKLRLDFRYHDLVLIEKWFMFSSPSRVMTLTLTL